MRSSLNTGSIFVYLFFLILRPPRRSTLFPYTTLFRSSFGSQNSAIFLATSTTAQPGSWSNKGIVVQTNSSSDHRSEEHTSELQSHSDLVCRLLLEKKNAFTPTCADGRGHSTAPLRSSA